MSQDISVSRLEADTRIPHARSWPSLPGEKDPQWLGSPSARRSGAVLCWLVIAGVASVLRLWQLDHFGLNSDEAVYAGQAASLAHAPAYTPYFPVFRAHPLLFQTVLSGIYRWQGVTPHDGRLLAVLVGLATVGVVYLIGRRLYGRRTGALAALLIAVMPYHVIVSRQILLDGTETLFAALSLYFVTRYMEAQRFSWLAAASASLGLAVLSKETAVLLLSGAYAFFALTRSIRLRLRHAVASVVVFLAVIIPYPASIVYSGRSHTGGSFLVWQLLRRPNHSWWFYPSVLPPALGWGLVIAVVAGFLLMWRRLDWREGLLVSWVLGPALFYEIWSVKGYEYLLPIAAPLAVLGAAFLLRAPFALGRWTLSARRTTWARAAAAVAVTASLAVPACLAVQPSVASTGFLAGTGGVPGGREAGEWVEGHVPEGAQLLALGPSMANIIEFYGHRKTYGLAVSPNPLHRNPVYDPIVNPDLQIRHGNLQYLIWDSYSASRSPFFSKHLLAYAERYHGRVVNEQFVTVRSNGHSLRQPVIVIYEVRP